MRSLFEAGCRAKKSYQTWNQADYACRMLKRYEDVICTPYRCKFCGAYHTGHVVRQARLDKQRKKQEREE